MQPFLQIRVQLLMYIIKTDSIVVVVIVTCYRWYSHNPSQQQENAKTPKIASQRLHNEDCIPKIAPKDCITKNASQQLLPKIAQLRFAFLFFPSFFAFAFLATQDVAVA